MRRLVFALALVASALSVVAISVGQEEKKGKGRRTVERTVLIPEDTTPFKAESRNIVRITGKGIADSKIVAKVDGPARIAAENSIRRVVNGKVLIGTGDKSFDVRPTGQGKVKVAVSVTPPQPGSETTTTTYEFEVE